MHGYVSKHYSINCLSYAINARIQYRLDSFDLSETEHKLVLYFKCDAHGSERKSNWAPLLNLE